MKRIGIIGAGIIGVSHKNAIMKNKDCCLAAVCDVVIEKAQSLVEGTDIPVFTDYKEMAEKIELDAVIINLPHFLHKEVTVYFLERRIAVLVEKPMANTVEECDAMIAAAEKNSTPLAVGHVQRYFEAYREVKKIIAQERLGRLCQITETRNINYFAENRPGWFLERAKAGGGITMNYGAHTLDKVFYTTEASVVKVAANGSNLLNDADVEAASQILLKLSNGASVSVSYSGCHVPYIEEVTFYFTEGVAKICGNRELYISEKGGKYERMELDYGKVALEEQLTEFLKLLNGEETEVVTPQYGREVISVLEEAFRQM